MRLVPQLADFAARQYGASPFLLRFEDGRWQGFDFIEAARAVHAFARLLEELGVGPRVTVGVTSENRPEYGLAYLAILDAGGIAVPLDVQLTAREHAEILSAADVSIAIGSARTLGVLEEARRARGGRLTLVSLDDGHGLPSFPEARRRLAQAGARPTRGEPGDVAALLFTSGTMGRPKGVMLSHANLLSNVEAVAQTFAFGPNDRLLSVLPLHHAFECTAGFLCPLRVGASVAYARGFKSTELREDLRTSGATVMLGVPLLYEKLVAAVGRGIDAEPSMRRAVARALRGGTRAVRRTTGLRIGRAALRPLRARAGLDGIRFLVSGAAALPASVFWGLVDLGWPVLEGYGLTECAPIVSAGRPGRSRPGSVGWPLPGIELRIVEPDVQGNGEIAVRGPNVMLGYHHDPAATAAVLRDGWFHTGDLGRLARDGALRITGRLKNMIATAAGKKIYPEEIEERLAGCPFVLELAVVGGRDPRGEREEVHAHVFPDVRALANLAAARGQPLDDAFVEEILRHEIEVRCRSLAPYKRVKRLLVRHEPFSKTTTGKIRRYELAHEPAAAAGPAVA